MTKTKYFTFIASAEKKRHMRLRRQNRPRQPIVLRRRKESQLPWLLSEARLRPSLSTNTAFQVGRSGLQKQAHQRHSLMTGNWKDLFLHEDGHSLQQKDRGDSSFSDESSFGPPSIGKTTVAHTVCREAGLELHEFNASDVRSNAGGQAFSETMMRPTHCQNICLSAADTGKLCAVK